MLEYVHKEGELSGDKLISIQEPTKDKAHNEELISFPEVSIDSGVFGSMLESQDDKREVSENTVADDLIESPTQIKGEYEKIEVRLKSEPETFIVKPKVLTTANPLGRSRAAADRGKEGDSMERDSADQAGGAAAAGSIEEEEVTFGAVYNYYSPPPDWGRPLSPESEMSIEIGSTVSEDIVEVAERFYTPGSSTEVSQPIAQSFHTPKSPVFFHTPSSDESGGFKTPQEYPFSPVEYKRPSTEDSSERFFSPVQFLTSPTDEGIEKTLSGMNVEENQILSQARGSLGLSTLQEKVQGIPPAFLKPLMKKNVFENDTLTFYAEVFGLPSPQVNWFRNKTQLVADDRVTIERDGDSISLTIQNVTRADQGEYICEAVNYVGEARSVAVVIVVSQEVRFTPVPPAVSHQHVMKFDVEEDDSSRSPSPQEILLEPVFLTQLSGAAVNTGETARFTVRVSGFPKPTVQWSHNGKVVKSSSVYKLIEEKDEYTLVITQVTSEYEGKYSCTATNRFGQTTCTTYLEVKKPEASQAEKWVEKMFKLTGQPARTEASFNYKVSGDPVPDIKWFKGPFQIQPSRNCTIRTNSDGSGFIIIKNVKQQDSGLYTCKASNQFGETACSAELVVFKESVSASHKQETAVQKKSYKVSVTEQATESRLYQVSLPGQDKANLQLEKNISHLSQL
uniref:Ig-like domain-containing protein n=1 Tax=Astatotilapia calliptera TaxID=8154 RepID=A0AAX7SHT8_ASTCA